MLDLLRFKADNFHYANTLPPPNNPSSGSCCDFIAGISLSAPYLHAGGGVELSRVNNALLFVMTMYDRTTRTASFIMFALSIDISEGLKVDCYLNKTGIIAPCAVFYNN